MRKRLGLFKAITRQKRFEWPLWNQEKLEYVALSVLLWTARSSFCWGETDFQQWNNVHFQPNSKVEVDSWFFVQPLDNLGWVYFHKGKMALKLSAVWLFCFALFRIKTLKLKHGGKFKTFESIPKTCDKVTVTTRQDMNVLQSSLTILGKCEVNFVEVSIATTCSSLHKV